MNETFDASWQSQNVLLLSGRFDASQTARAEAALDRAQASVTVDFADLAYISSAGIGTLLAAHKRLLAAGCSLRLANMNPHIRELFELAGLDMVFEMD